MKKYKVKSNIAAVAASTLVLSGASVSAATVWNVNVGNSSVETTNEITTGDNYQGAATENTASSTWNAVSSTTLVTLDDSTGDDTAGVTFQLTAAVGSVINFGGQNLLAGDEVFNTWIKDGDAGPGDVVNDDPFSITFGNLDAGVTYDLVVYSDWWWGTNALPVEQTAGTGLTGSFTINSPQIDGTLTPGSNGGVGPLLEDTDFMNTAGNSNYARFNGLEADGSGNITLQLGGVGNVNHPTNGFQLIAVPEPSSAALLGLGGLALILRRRK
ncbi:MAG: PEP-CTERM sorting domain-containing protein [Akkermansiaceae bacterium]